MYEYGLSPCARCVRDVAGQKAGDGRSMPTAGALGVS